MPRRRDRPKGFAFQAPRSGGCGWWTSKAGMHDPAFVGHHPWCPARLYPDVRTAEDLADQWAALEAAWAMSAPLGDYLERSQENWHAWAEALIDRAEMLGLGDAPLMAAGLGA